MKIRVPVIDGRSFDAINLGPHNVIDEETGKAIGTIEGHRGSMGIDRSRWAICLFGKYNGYFERRDECVAFAEGVEAVINQVVSVPKRFADSDAA